MSRICVISPARNCVEWVERSVRSIQAQADVDFHCAFIDDHSDDGTWERVNDVVGADSRFTLIQPPERAYTLANNLLGVKTIVRDPHDIIVICDGDDWLAHPGVLKRVREIYQDEQVWMTYGNHTRWKGTLRERLRRKPKAGLKRDYPAVIRRNRLYRYHRFQASHLRTYKNFLFQSIRDEDLRRSSGEYFRIASDVAVMVPMLEMAGPDHARFVPEILYIYNNNNPMSDHRAHADEQVLSAAEITQMRPYDALSDAPPRTVVNR